MKDDFNRYILTSFEVIIGCAVIVAAIVFLLTSDIASRASDISTNRDRITKQSDSVVMLADIKNNSAEAQEYTTAMDALLPPQNELINFPKWLQGVAATYSVNVDFSFTSEIIAPNSTAPGSNGFSLTVTGNSDNVISFLKYLELEAPAYLLSLGSFDLSQNGSDVKIVIGGKLFFK